MGGGCVPRRAGPTAAQGLQPTPPLPPETAIFAPSIRQSNLTQTSRQDFDRPGAPGSDPASWHLEFCWKYEVGS